MKGLVTKSTGSWYKVRINTEEVEARLRGKIRTQGLKSTNPVVVGDEVILQKEGEEYLISEVLERRNCIVRKSNKLSKQHQLIAANVDLLLLLVTPGQPYTPAGFIDRLLATAEAYAIPSILIINKSDLDSKKISAYREELFELYSSIGYPCYNLSLLEETAIETIKPLIKGQTVLIAGNSGVGKSTLVNALQPGHTQKTGTISKSYHKGKHTTTFAQMFSLGDETYIIDTPGIKDFGLVNFEKNQLAHFFPEMKALLSECKFSNCLHVEEPDCAVIEALDKGEIPHSRYFSYLSMLEEIEAANG